MSQGWNFRIVKIKKENEFESGFVDARVYYNDDGSIYGYTLNPILFGEDEETLKWELSERLRAFDKPIFEEVGGPEPENCRLVEMKKVPVVAIVWGSRKRHIAFDRKLLCETEHKGGYSKGGHYNSYDLDPSVFEKKKERKDTEHTHSDGIIEFKPLEEQGIIKRSICKKCLGRYQKKLQ